MEFTHLIFIFSIRRESKDRNPYLQLDLELNIILNLNPNQSRFKIWNHYRTKIETQTSHCTPFIHIYLLINSFYQFYLFLPCLLFFLCCKSFIFNSHFFVPYSFPQHFYDLTCKIYTIHWEPDNNGIERRHHINTLMYLMNCICFKTNIFTRSL